MEKKIKIKGIVDRNKYLYDNKVYGGGYFSDINYYGWR